MLALDFLFYIFIGTIACQAFYYGVIFMQFAFVKEHKKTRKNTPVSVIICAKNESKNLKRFLHSVICQDYKNYEIVLINDASYDDTLEVMKSFKVSHDNIKIVNVKSIEAFWGNKKYALTLGIKASTHELLLFTDADCEPLSPQWISEMTSHFSNEKSLVLGYGAYHKKKHNFLNKVIRFETLLTAVQYFSYSIIGLPYMGVGRNLAYRKEEFFNVGGFINHIKTRSGDDDLFVNQVATKHNTAICFSKDSFTASIAKDAFKDWFQQKRRHVSTAKHYKFKHQFLLGLFYSSQFLFWTTAITLLLLGFRWEFVLGLTVFRIALQFISIGVSAKKLNETDLIILLPFLELFLIIVQFLIFITNLISKPSHWK
ncbi:MAG: glycosyltransferase [Flavobacteriaceae bacterium]|nr:glycosyltransferase [Flavobacteriaceae bacterium]